MFFDLLSDFLTRLADTTATLDPWQQALFLVLIGAIPFVESYGGAFVGTIAGVSPALALTAPIIGNMICTFVLIAVAAKTRQAVQRRRGTANAGDRTQELSKRQQKVQNALSRYGVPGVCLFGPLIVASQITAPTLIALGARPSKVYLFQGISIVAWGVAFMLLARAATAAIVGA